jgi:predicted amidophosphoribosyltransferase
VHDSGASDCCSHCGADLSELEAPSFCPDCGAALGDR